ncbi:hypothetical protein, partial [Gulbenkiania mobilis]|uniref:hypothetical protein n=1 Tax=Gulbenkiania mobilis TaxID=397457 RepID=UPI001F1E100D
INAKALTAHQCLARGFQKDAFVGGLTGHWMLSADCDQVVVFGFRYTKGTALSRDALHNQKPFQAISAFRKVETGFRIRCASLRKFSAYDPR